MYAVMDIANAMRVIKDIYAHIDNPTDAQLDDYGIAVHGMKSALANIGESELSAVAARLERAGQEKDTAAMSAETGEFVDELRAIIEKFAPQNEDDEAGDRSGYDHEYLREKLLVIKEACEAYDKKSAKDAIAELRQQTWPRPVKEQLGAMAEFLLNGDFEEVSRAAEIITTGF